MSDLWFALSIGIRADQGGGRGRNTFCGGRIGRSAGSAGGAGIRGVNSPGPRWDGPGLQSPPPASAALRRFENDDERLASDRGAVGAFSDGGAGASEIAPSSYRADL